MGVLPVTFVFVLTSCLSPSLGFEIHIRPESEKWLMYIFFNYCLYQ
jgi:hypothetical protein